MTFNSSILYVVYYTEYRSFLLRVLYVFSCKLVNLLGRFTLDKQQTTIQHKRGTLFKNFVGSNVLQSVE